MNRSWRRQTLKDFISYGIETRKSSRKFIKLGFKAIVTSIDSDVLGKDFVGREYDEQFLSDLPKNVDPCGENGKFHSFMVVRYFDKKHSSKREKLCYRKAASVLVICNRYSQKRD